MNVYGSYFGALFFCVMSANINSMEQLFSYVDNETKNALAKTCTTFHAMGRRNNCLIYTHNPLVLNTDQKKYALLCSIHYGNAIAVENLLCNGAGENYYCGLPGSSITLAYYYNNEAIMTALKKYGVINYYGTISTFFVIATHLGDLPLLETCINNNDFNPLYRDDWYGESLLQIASRNGHTHIVKRLLQDQQIVARINDTVRTYKTALDFAVKYGHGLIVEQLLAVPGIYKNRYGALPTIYTAALHKRHCVAALLLDDPDINVNTCNSNNESSLYCATLNDDLEMVKILLMAKNINVNIISKDKKTALDIVKTLNIIKRESKTSESTEIERLLVADGAKTFFYLNRINPWNEAENYNVRMNQPRY